MEHWGRRHFLKLMLGSCAAPFVLITGCGGRSGDATALPTSDSARPPASLFEPQPSTFTDLALDARRIFSLGVASGDPTATGVMLWTRIEPAAWRPDWSLFLEVAEDRAFRRVVVLAQVMPDAIDAINDFTVRLDADGLLGSNRRYYYRFIYGRSASPVGRCRTAPEVGTSVSRLSLAVLTCQDYTNGYYPALSAIADDDSIDYVVHLGDFIYESAGDPRFQQLPFADRLITLPSVDFPVAMTLADYRNIYRTYRSDPHLQHCMAQHTWIITRDDHETGNDAYWDYANNTVGLPDHPYTRDEQFAQQRLMLLNQLMLDSQQAWFEYVPARVQYESATADPHRRLRYHRQLPLGDLVDLFMLDTRTYRTPHPCGEAQVFGRYGPVFCNQWHLNQDQTLLGKAQFDWLLDGLAGSRAHWQVLGNQTLMSPLWFERRRNMHDGGTEPPSKNRKRPLSVEAWDGYDAERMRLAQGIEAVGAQDVIVLTGDLHAAAVSYVQKDFVTPGLQALTNVVAKEFMTPAVTSSSLMEIIAPQWVNTPGQDFVRALTDTLVRANNPHMQYFNATISGYSVMRLSAEVLDWQTFVVDKNRDTLADTPQLLVHYRSRRGDNMLERVVFDD